MVEIAHGREEFLAKLDQVLSKPQSSAEVKKRIARVASESWDGRLREVLDVVEEHRARIDRRKAVVTAPVGQATIS